MALTIALYAGNRPVAGVEVDWLQVEHALATTEDPLPYLRSVDPAETTVFIPTDVADLIGECDHLLRRTSGDAARTLGLVKDLAQAVRNGPESDLRFVAS